MIRRTFGAPFGGTTCGGQYGFDWSACRLISPPNFGGGAGRYFPSMVVVAPGEPGVPVICCACAATPVRASKAQPASSSTVERRKWHFVGMGSLLGGGHEKTCEAHGRIQF